MNEKKNIGHLFDHIASHYDVLNHLLSMNVDRSWRRQAVHSLPKNSELCLDVATGTGDLAIAIVKAGRAKRVVGVDLSDNMMEIGERKVAKAGLETQITFRHADCAELPFANGTFDIVTCSYGVRNFADLDHSLDEMYRVLVPGGQLRILEFAYPKNIFMRATYDLYFTHILPFIGRKVSHDSTAYGYLPRSVKNFMWGEEFLAHLRSAGFAKTSFVSQTFGISMMYKATKPL